MEIEGQDISIIETSTIYADLKIKLLDRKSNVFLPLQVRQSLKLLEEEGILKPDIFKGKVVEFYDTCIQYLEEWEEPIKHADKWILLRTQPTHNNIEVCIDYIIQHFPAIPLIEDELFDEICFVLRYVTENKITHWKKNSVSVSNRWIETFKTFNENDVSFKNIGKIVEYCLCLPGTNAPAERVFSLMNNMWSTDKTQLQVETLKCLLITKYNFNQTCDEFHKEILAKY